MTTKPSRWRFLLLFALAIVAAEMMIAGLSVAGAPAGTHWLGDTIENASDVAVYLSNIRQGADGNILLKNLYAIEPAARRFDLFWSALGLLARTGASPILIHETARWICTILLVFAVFFAARSLTTSDNEAKLATVLAFAGVSLGWIKSIWLALAHMISVTTPAAPDVSTEFSIPPTLLGGAHIILSMALLMTTLWLAWRAFERQTMRDAWLSAAALGILVCFHPYFVPLFACYFVILLAVFARKAPIKTLAKLILPFVVCALPSIAIYLPLAFDPVFREHHLVDNILPLASWRTWLLVLAPFIAAFGWRIWKKKEITPRERWVFAWIAAALIAMFFPFPWKRKLTEGLDVALIFATLPAWVALWNAIKSPSRIQTWANHAMFLMVAAFVPFQLLTTELAWLSNPTQQGFFYQSTGVFATWKFIHDKTPQDSVVVTDDMWANIWTPAETDRTVFIGHAQETPGYNSKYAAWLEFDTTDDSKTANEMLDGMHASTLLTTSTSSSAHYKSLLNASWQPVFTSGQATVFERQDGVALDEPRKE
ncbi:MAG: hypothetical protein WA001_04625 [Patescibacteria group bacterium]